MWEDLQQLWAEFDVDMLVRPQAPDQFVFALLIVGIVGGLAFIALKFIFELLR